MMDKQLFVIFNDNKGIFTHVLLNVFDFHEKGYDVGVVFESVGCKLINEYEGKEYEKWERLKNKKLVAAVCKVCAKSVGALESAERQNLPIRDELFGHPPLEEWVKQGYKLIFI
jgi:hypothetical protein